MKYTCTTRKWNTNGTIGSDTGGAGTWADHGEILEIGRSYPADGPTLTNRHMPSLSAVVEQVVRSTEPHSRIPISELPPLVLEPNRRRVDPEELEEVEEPTSPLLVTGQKLARTIRSLSMK